MSYTFKQLGIAAIIIIIFYLNSSMTPQHLQHSRNHWVADVTSLITIIYETNFL